MNRTKMVSFDLDGTVTDISFADSVWLEGIPRFFADKNGVSLEDAKRQVMGEYARVGKDRLEWYDLGYWIEKLCLDVRPEILLNSFQHKIKIYPEVVEVLEEFSSEGFRLIIVSNARREFVNLELQKTNIARYFERVYSSTSDFGLIKKTAELYRKICRICNVFPNEVTHVGDDHTFDFEIPRRLGINSFYLDRTGKKSGEYVVHSLKELGGKLADKNQCAKANPA
jgi:putative hydrolase of the HAD superfamily